MTKGAKWPAGSPRWTARADAQPQERHAGAQGAPLFDDALAQAAGVTVASDPGSPSARGASKKTPARDAPPPAPPPRAGLLFIR